MPFFHGFKGQGVEYVASSSQCLLLDRFKIDDETALRERSWSVKNVSALFDLDSSFSNGAPLQAKVISHLNAASWIVQIPSGFEGGLLVRKLYDRFHGRQRARIMADGQFVGWWYEPAQDRRRRWAWAQFGIPASFVEGKQTLKITIDPPAGVPLWSVGQIELWGVTG